MIIYNPPYNEMPVPTIGKEYHFFDDGKISDSRHYLAVVDEIISKEQAKKIIISTPRGESLTNENVFIDMSLYDIWVDDVKEHYWIMAEDTDYFVKCSIPEYDKDPIYFARTVDGGWFSMDVTSWWQGGRLDVDGKRYESLMKYYHEMD